MTGETERLVRPGLESSDDMTAYLFAPPAPRIKDNPSSLSRTATLSAQLAAGDVHRTKHISRGNNTDLFVMIPFPTHCLRRLRSQQRQIERQTSVQPQPSRAAEEVNRGTAHFLVDHISIQTVRYRRGAQVMTHRDIRRRVRGIGHLPSCGKEPVSKRTRLVILIPI